MNENPVLGGSNPGMAQKVAVPSESSMLLPENNTGVIVSGKRVGEGYRVYPLVESVFRKLSEKISDFWDKYTAANVQCVHGGTFCTQMQVICATDSKLKDKKILSPKPCSSSSCAFFTPHQSGDVFKMFMASGIAPDIISYSVCGSEEMREEFADNMTAPQMMDALRTIWKINMDVDSTLPEETGKNVKGLLVQMGWMEGQSAETTLTKILSVLSKMDKDNPVRIEIGESLKSNADSQKFISVLETGSDSTKNTSTEEPTGNANHSESSVNADLIKDAVNV